MHRLVTKRVRTLAADRSRHTSPTDRPFLAVRDSLDRDRDGPSPSSRHGGRGRGRCGRDRNDAPLLNIRGRP